MNASCKYLRVLVQLDQCHLCFIFFSRIFYDKRIAAEVEVDALGEEFKGYVMKITGGNDKQGFAMVQGVMLAGRVRLLLDLRMWHKNLSQPTISNLPKQ